MASRSSNSAEEAESFSSVAAVAGQALSRKMSAEGFGVDRDKALLSFELGEYAGILGPVQQRFAEEFRVRHPGGRLFWGKGIIVLMDKTAEQGTFDKFDTSGEEVKRRWLLALVESIDREAGASLNLREELNLKRGEIYLRYAVG